MRRNLLALLSVLFFGATVIQACSKDDSTSAIVPPAPVSTVTPVSNPIPNDTAALGQLLFWDPILSGGKDVACATCHHPKNAYTDGSDLSLGPNAVGYGQYRRFLRPNDVPVTKRNTPSLINVAFNGMDDSGHYDPSTAPMFWDSRTQALENQLIGPLTTFEEMRGHAYSDVVALDSIVARLTNIAEYKQLFQRVFGNNQPITPVTIGKAISAFERSLVAMDSPYDRYQKAIIYLSDDTPHVAAGVF